MLGPRSDLPLNLLWSGFHGDLESVAHSSAKQGLQGAVDASVDASFSRIGGLAVPLLELVNELLDLAELTEDELSSERILVLTLEPELAEGNWSVSEGFHLSIHWRVGCRLVHSRHGLIPGEDFGNSERDGGREVRVCRAGASEQDKELINRGLVS